MATAWREDPRLTTALREFGNVSQDISEVFDQTKARRHSSPSDLTWQELVTILWTGCKQRHSSKQLRSYVLELISQAGEMVGEDESIEMKETFAAEIFLTTMTLEQVESKHINKIRKTLPTATNNDIRDFHETVKKIKSFVGPSVFNKIKSQVDEIRTATTFGTKIKFSNDLPSLLQSTEMDSDDEAQNDNNDKLTDSFRQLTISQVKATEKSSSSNKISSSFDVPWLEKNLRKYFHSDHFLPNIMSLLQSSSSNDHLQNELFDLLGFDRFDLIQELLEHRQDLLKDQKRREILESGSRFKSIDSRPTYGCQVTVQTDQEKQVSKAFRREEKRFAKKGMKNGNDDGGDSEIMNPDLLREQRAMALLQAASAPLFSQRGKSIGNIERYPHVYDSQLSAKHSAALAGGKKMTLPEGFETKSTKVYEEIRIPVKSSNLRFDQPLVKIKDLDEVSQLAFSGMKQLNRVQSCVYESAFKTNENLLICAPTGAGKTNVAMLTVIREIKRNIVEGVIQKDKFKIVYVAPMKALAAEMTRNFGGRLESLGVKVRELTGDMQLTKSEIIDTQMLITTPEKWDVVTRKAVGDTALAQLVRLLIIDEVHLLHDERGPVLETLVARTLRQVETQQSMIRIVGLSATLPNYLDVASFLRVNPHKGLFYFDGRFRPVPLEQTFIGVKTMNRMQQAQDMNNICYEKAARNVERGHQVLVFVHARNATVKTAQALLEIARNNGETGLFDCRQMSGFGQAEKQMSNSRNRELRELFASGFGIHHAGMLRPDRNLVERNFSQGFIKVLCCTATLAWGVNLPAHAVVIKGTEIYDAKQGTFVDLGILDVMQIFGRAGRPQFDTSGEGTIITSYTKLSHYLALLTRQNPIESQFVAKITDNLNAEICLGTVNSVEDGVKWLSYTYLYTRMRKNPLVYGISYDRLAQDPLLERWRSELIVNAGKNLAKAKMTRFTERTGYFNSTDMGRTASHYYINHHTIELFNEMINPTMSISNIFVMISKCSEFEQIKLRDDELEELDDLIDTMCLIPPGGGSENTYGKVNILLQTYISRGSVRSFSLTSDLMYIAQNAGRIVRGLFDIAVKQGEPVLTKKLLDLCKCVDRRMWPDESPLQQFPILKFETLRKIKEQRLTIDKMQDMNANDIGHMLRHPRIGTTVKMCVKEFPAIELETTIQPITRSVLRIRLTIIPRFKWHRKVHGTTGEPWWIWVEDPETNMMYHSEYFILHMKHVENAEEQQLVFTIPIVEPVPSQYMVHAESDRWLGASAICPISFQHLILPDRHPPHTELLDLEPLPTAALKEEYRCLYKFTHFNPIQTQIFHCLYHNDCNALIGAPTGSGKTVAAELAILRMFNTQPKSKAVYIAPMKALVRERISDWKLRFGDRLGKTIVELTGDVAPDMRAVARADIIVTTPEKWDGISRSWQTRNYVKSVSLIIIDEIHLLGEDRGPVLEVIVSRTNFISSHTDRLVRIVGLSTALANARDLADWLGIKQLGLFNFRPSVRPVPMEVHIQGFAGKHYCPRMASMNKPCFQAIRTHSPAKPVLIFVASRRQTRLTALDLIAYLAAEDDPKQWLHMDEWQMEELTRNVQDNNLRLTLAFGIGLHHAGLVEKDRTLVEELFVNQKIQILVATATVAWGVNFPAHLVIVKGTEYFDGKTKRYVDFPITDVLQMMGRAGRPQFDDNAVAVVLVHDVKKHFYKKFLYDPFPVESSLLDVLPDHLNAEIVAGTIMSKQDALDYLTWTYFFRRLLMNPTYYNLERIETDMINEFLTGLVEKELSELLRSCCVVVDDVDDVTIEPTSIGRIASYYYLSHLTVRMLCQEMKSGSTIPDILQLLTECQEYNELPVRHNEDIINKNLSEHLPLQVSPDSFGSSSTKAHLLFQAHFSRIKMPSSDYATDLKSVLDQAFRILQGMIDISADEGMLITTLRVMHMAQMVAQGIWFDNRSTLLTLPYVEEKNLFVFKQFSFRGDQVRHLPELMSLCKENPSYVKDVLMKHFTEAQAKKICDHLRNLPVVDVKLHVKGSWEKNEKIKQKIVPDVHGVGIQNRKTWMDVHMNQEYHVAVSLARLNKGHHDGKALTPRFPKPKLEGWFLLLADVERKEVIALKRVQTLRNRTTELLSFYPDNIERKVYSVWLVSDSYLGLDQRYDVRINVTQPISNFQQDEDG
ncbi:activating signal cointegrator 1 complex subunit 3-like [Styela clava]